MGMSLCDGVFLRMTHIKVEAEVQQLYPLSKTAMGFDEKRMS